MSNDAFPNLFEYAIRNCIAQYATNDHLTAIGFTRDFGKCGFLSHGESVGDFVLIQGSHADEVIVLDIRNPSKYV